VKWEKPVRAKPSRAPLFNSFFRLQPKDPFDYFLTYAVLFAIPYGFFDALILAKTVVISGFSTIAKA
jgi:hypothetical protein